MFKLLTTALLALTVATSANANCFYGEKNLPGSLGPGQNDNSRSFTVDRFATFVVRVKGKGVLTANLGCGWKTGKVHRCPVEVIHDTREVSVKLKNPTHRQVTYRWICLSE